MRAAAVLFLLAGLALAGCAETPPAPVTHTCPDGAVVTVPTHTTAQPGAACPRPPPAPPSIAFTPPEAVRVHRPIVFSWTVLPGNHTGGHSVLTSVRVSTASQADTARLAGPDSYGIEAVRKEHQNLPQALAGEHTFTAPGTYYVRAYATIQADDLEARDYWTPESVLAVADVPATGNVTTVVHPVGNSAGALAPNPVRLRIGDALALRNDDVTPHAFSPQGCPQGVAAVTVASMATSAPIVFKAPGTCTFTTDDVQPQTLTVNVSV